MRVLFFFVAAVIMGFWYAWFVRPSNKTLSNQILIIAGIVSALLALAYVRLI